MATFNKVTFANASPRGTGDNRLNSIPAKAKHVNDLIDSLQSGANTYAGANTFSGLTTLSNATNAIGNKKFMNFGASLAATNGGTTTYGANDILVEIGSLDTTSTTYANGIAPTKILVEKVVVIVQTKSHDTHVGTIVASATSGTATNAAVSSGTEIVGASAAAIDTIISAAPSVTEIDIDLDATNGTVHVFAPNITLPIATNHLYLVTTTAIDEDDFQVGRYSIQVEYTLL